MTVIQFRTEAPPKKRVRRTIPDPTPDARGARKYCQELFENYEWGTGIATYLPTLSEEERDWVIDYFTHKVARVLHVFEPDERYREHVVEMLELLGDLETWADEVNF